jgi:two-component system, LytTR family, sensor histidine kinase LytS
MLGKFVIFKMRMNAILLHIIVFNTRHLSNAGYFEYSSLSFIAKSNFESIYKLSISPLYYTTGLYSNMLPFLSIAFILSLSVAVFYFIKYKQLKNKAALKEIETDMYKNRAAQEMDLLALEQKASIAQMNPHFIFNALNTINSLYTNGNIEKANVFLNKFSNLLRMVLIHSDKHTVTITSEIKLLILYFECNTINSNYPFSYDIIIDSNIDCENVLIPTMLIQPFVENAIIHGISSLNEKGHVEVRFNLIKMDVIECIVLDNGVGLKRARKTFSSHESKAIDITKKRINRLHQTINLDYGIEIKERWDGNKSLGTQVRFAIPVKSNY